MSDLFAAALERMEKLHRGEMYGCVDCYRGNPCGERELAAAARRVAEAPEVWWCKEHESIGSEHTLCDAFDGYHDCRMVRKLLVDPPHPQPDQEDE